MKIQVPEKLRALTIIHKRTNSDAVHVSPGSKSERDAVELVTSDATYVLRLPGGNPFRDPELDALVGKHVTFHGELCGHVFFVSDWDVQDPAG